MKDMIHCDRYSLHMWKILFITESLNCLADILNYELVFIYPTDELLFFFNYYTLITYEFTFIRLVVDAYKW